MRLSKILRMPNSEYFRNVATLMTGAVFAQAIPVLAALVLTRQFAPGEFGVLALFISIGTMLAVAATFRYAQAILVPEDPQRAYALLVLSIGIAAVFSLFTLAISPALVWYLQTGSSYDALGKWVYAIPLFVFVTAASITFYAWCNRFRAYRTMATSRVIQNGATSGVQVAAGAAALGSGGLIAGAVIGPLLGTGVLFKDGVRAMQALPFPTWAVIKEEARKYRDFPLFSLPADIINTVANQLPVILLTAYFGFAVVGHYNLTNRILAVPLAFLGAAVLTVFQERAARDYAQTGSCRAIYIKTAKTLLFLGLPSFLLLFVLAPWLFAVAFGAEWRTAGEFTQILVPLFLLRFIASPLSYVFYIAGKQRVDLLWQVALLIVTITAFVLGGTYGNERLSLTLFAAGYSCLYLLYLYLSFRFTVAPGPAVRVVDTNASNP